MELAMGRQSANLMRGSAMAFFLVLILIVDGASARVLVINQSAIPIAIRRTLNNGVNDNLVVAGRSSIQLPSTFSASDVTLQNQVTGAISAPLTLRRNTVMLIQSTAGGVFANTVTVLLGTFLQGVITALTTFIVAL